MLYSILGRDPVAYEQSRPEPKIVCDGIRHWFIDQRTRTTIEAIGHATLEVHEREFVAIVGPSGCGKTTLLNMIAGLVQPSEGVVRCNGQVVTGPRPAEVGYMSARDVLLPWRTVLRNVALGLELRRVKNREKLAKDVLSLVGLQDFAGHYPDQLSQGMRQRAVLASTLVREPQVLLMDEPFGALDAQTRLLMQNEFLRLWDQHQSTVVFVTHDLVEAIALADRVVVFSARPGHIKSQYEVRLPRPRIVDELQGNDAFQTLYRNIWRDLKSETQEADHEERHIRPGTR